MRLFYVLFIFLIFYPFLKILGRVLKLSLRSFYRCNESGGPSVTQRENDFRGSSSEKTLRKQKIVDAEFKEISS